MQTEGTEWGLILRRLSEGGGGGALCFIEGGGGTGWGGGAEGGAPLPPFQARQVHAGGPTRDIGAKMKSLRVQMLPGPPNMS